MAQIFDFESLTNGRGAILTGVTLSYVFENGVKTAVRNGVTYYVVIPTKEYQKASIRVDDMNPIITSEDLRTAMDVTDTYIEFDGFTAKWYKSGKEWRISGRATRARLVTR